MSLFTNLFYPAFFSLFILSFFLIEGDYRFYLFSSWLAFIFIFGKFFRVMSATATKSQLRVLAFSLVLMVLFSITIFFSISPPLTIEKAMFYLVTFVIFIFFVLVSRHHISIPKFLYYLSLTTLVLNIFVLFFTLIPPPVGLFPAMNILVRIFGHNYYAAHLLLMLPIFWWQFLYSKQQDHLFDQKIMRFLSLFLLFSSYLLLFFSLARWSMLIGFLQLAVIFLMNKTAFIELLHNQFAYAALKVFLLVLFVLLSIFLFLPFFFSNHEFCPLNFSYKEMCKPLLSNDRWQYWQKAVWVWQTSPWVGTGLKTFGFASRQFVLENYNYSSYAHNIFLLNLAEGGVMIGIPFIACIIYLLVRVWKISRSSKEVLPVFIFLAIGASLANALFDITWNFFVVFLLTMIFIALVLRLEVPKEKLSNLKNFQFWQKATLFIFFLLFGLSLLLSTGFFIQGFLIKKNKDLALRLFPFFDQPVRDLVFAKELTPDHYQQLYPLYRFDPDFIYNYAKLEEIDSAKRAALLSELVLLDPLLLAKNLTFVNLEPHAARPLIDAFLLAAKRHHILNNTHFLDYWHQRNLAIDVFQLANQAYLQQEYQLAAHLYHQAMELDAHVLSGVISPVFLNEKNLDVSAQFLAHFQNLNPESMKDFYAYMNLYQRTLLHLFAERRLDEFFDLTDKIVKFLPNHSWFIVRDLMVVTTNEDQEALFQVYQRYKEWPVWEEVSYQPIAE